MNEQAGSEQLRSGAPAEPKAGWVYVKDLPTPPEVAEAVDSYCKHYGYRGKKRLEVEEQFKLSFYYGGKYVGYLRRPEGLAIFEAVGTPEEYAAFKASLPPQDRQRLMLYAAPVWNESSIPTCWELNE
jgi:hypothetical protein